MSKIINPHDRFFREVFSRREAARDFVENYLPSAVVEKLDLDSLKPAKDSFVDKELRTHFSDLLFTVEFKEPERRSGRLYFLFEHKSSPDKWTAFQLLRYMVRIWELERKKDAKALLPPIIPAVLYHGESKWKISRSFQSLTDMPPGLESYVPAFEYELCDLASLSDGEVKGMVILKTALLALKHIRNNDIAEKLPGIFTLLSELATKTTGLEYLETLLRYVTSASDSVDAEMLINVLESALPNTGETIMPTLAQKWMEEGELRGLEKGREEGRKQGEASIFNRLLQLKFKEIPSQFQAKIDEADADTLLRWGERILSAQTLDEIFAD